MNLSKQGIERVLIALSELNSSLNSDNAFDEAETVEDAIGVITSLVRAYELLDHLPEEAPVEEVLPGDMATLRSYCAEMKDYQVRLLGLKAQAADLRVPLDFLRLKKIPDLMAALDVKTATFAGLGRVQTATDLYAKTTNKDASFQYLRDTGYEDMIKPTVNASSLKALLRRMLKEGIDIPDCYEVTPFVRASIVKA